MGDAGGHSRYILTLPKVGYKFIADVRRIPDARAEANADLPAAPPNFHRSGPAAATAQKVQQCCLKGRYFWNQKTEEGFHKSIRYFEKAIDVNPGYAKAYVGLADCYSLLAYYTLVSPRETYPKAIVAVRKALELDSTLAEAHASLALAEVDFKWQ